TNGPACVLPLNDTPMWSPCGPMKMPVTPSFAATPVKQLLPEQMPVSVPSIDAPLPAAMLIGSVIGVENVQVFRATVPPKLMVAVRAVKLVVIVPPNEPPELPTLSVKVVPFPVSVNVNVPVLAATT